MRRLSSLHLSLPMPDMTIRNRIRVLRFERRMTQEELAVRVGVSRQTIMSIENGHTNPSVLLAFKIAKALEAPITDVFNAEGKLVPI
jgi:putative transcriptional regulator